VAAAADAAAVAADQAAAADDVEDGFARRGCMFAKADNPFVLFNAAGKDAAVDRQRR
jgi:hypothetical protein